ncbi:hypothetical protein JCM8547_000210 [Rhodosporidiobolus lusitaniae]
MQAALAALQSSSTSRQPTPSFSFTAPGGATVTPSGHLPPNLDPLRLRLVQLIDALALLHSHLSYLAYSSPLPPSTAQPGLLSFPELVGRYQLLLTHLGAVQGLLSSQQEKEREKERDREEGGGLAQGGGGRRRKRDDGRDAKREKWESVAVVPAVEVDEAKDWMVGMLLRTKQTPEVESSQSTLTSSLPSPFSAALSSASSDSGKAFQLELDKHASFLNTAYDRVTALREFNSEGESWEWKERVELEPEEEAEEGEEAGEGMQLDEREEGKKEEQEGEKKRAWTAKEVQTYLRMGKRPEL